jgi:hypothetical protein
MIEPARQTTHLRVKTKMYPWCGLAAVAQYTDQVQEAMRHLHVKHSNTSGVGDLLSMPAACFLWDGPAGSSDRNSRVTCLYSS